MLNFQTSSRVRRLSAGAGVLALCLGAGFAAWGATPSQVAGAQTSLAASAGAGPVLCNGCGPSGPPAPIVLPPRPWTYERLETEPQPPRTDTLTVATNGVRRTLLVPRPFLLPPALQEVARDSSPEALAEIEAGRAARRTIAAAKEVEAARLAAGQPPQPLTPELQAAFTAVRTAERARAQRAFSALRELRPAAQTLP